MGRKEGSGHTCSQQVLLSFPLPEIQFDALSPAPVPLLAFFGSFSGSGAAPLKSSFLHFQVYLEVKVMIPSLQL